jgi:D-alanine-D-alanine ligase
MDKAIMKRLMVALGIPVAPYVSLTSEDFAGDQPELVRQVERQLSYPCFVKPARGGSSIGITRVADHQRLASALQTAFAEDNKVLVEQEIVGREIEIGLLGNRPVQCSLPGEFVREPAFFDYRCKYLDQDLAMRIPADISNQAYQEMCGYAIAVFQEFDCSGLFRADFFLTESGAVYFNEINTLPGFTGFSMYPSLWAKAGLALSELIDQLVELALQRRGAEQALNKGALVSD